MSFDPGFDSSMNFRLLIKWLSCSSLTFKDQKTSRYFIELTVSAPQILQCNLHVCDL